MNFAFERRTVAQPDCMEMDEAADSNQQKPQLLQQQCTRPTQQYQMPWAPNRDAAPHAQNWMESQPPSMPCLSGEMAADQPVGSQQRPSYPSQFQLSADPRPPSLDGFDLMPELSAAEVQQYFCQLTSSASTSSASASSAATVVVMVVTQSAGSRPASAQQSVTEDAAACESTRSMDYSSDSGSAQPPSCGMEPEAADLRPMMSDPWGMAAEWILSQHCSTKRDFASDTQRFKQKPMVHEFFGYILFLGSDGRIPALQGCAFFWNPESGQRAPPSASQGYFKLANFSAVAQVWRRLKANSSQDCTKNLKRAIRMSISNERQYFIDILQANHRLHIYRFGLRSMQFFRQIFPLWFTQL